MWISLYSLGWNPDHLTARMLLQHPVCQSGCNCFLWLLKVLFKKSGVDGQRKRERVRTQGRVCVQVLSLKHTHTQLKRNFLFKEICNYINTCVWYIFTLNCFIHSVYIYISISYTIFFSGVHAVFSVSPTCFGLSNMNWCYSTETNKTEV